MNAARLHSSGSLSRLVRALLCVGLVVGVWASPVRAQTVWELRPYQIRVVLAAGSAPELTPRLQADLREGLISRVDALIGAAWDLDVAVVTAPHLASQMEALVGAEANDTLADPPQALRRAMISDPEAVTIDLFPKQWLDPDVLDKVILVAVLPGPAAYRVTARELDVRTLTWSTPVSVSVWHPAKLRDAVFEAVRKTFSPLGEIVSVDLELKRVTLRVRAAGFPPRDKASIEVTAGDLFQPILRHYGTDGELRRDPQGKPIRPTPVPWTFLTVEESTPSGIVCALHTGLRTPLSARRRGRVERLALGVTPPDKPTTLFLQSRADPEQAMAGYDIYSHPPDSKASELLGRTDRQGGLSIRPGEYPLRVLLVKNGGLLLARLPVVPGLQAELTAQIAPDDQRLEAEGFLTGLQEELIDLVTRRQVLLAQAQHRIENKDFDEAEKLVRRLQGLDDRNDFTLYLMQERKKVASNDKYVQAKIKIMFDETQKLVNEYLAPEPIEQIGHRLVKARAGERKAGS